LQFLKRSREAVPAYFAGPLKEHKSKTSQEESVKTTLFAAALVAALTLTAAAAQKKPAPSQHLAGNSEQITLAPVHV
jgi:hypothetical protein